ncbi:MAG TPA: FG-GAP-like repeat-containing protein [Acidimicrobiales bacterium]|nr:FG-GAP-like repeat-containing protein [Acidimicrobiales bacterium]
MSLVAVRPRPWPRLRRRTGRVVAIQTALALLIGAAGVLAPRPALVTERAMATETRRPGRDAVVRPAPPPPAEPSRREPPGPPGAPGTSTTAAPGTTQAPGPSTTTAPGPVEPPSPGPTPAPGGGTGPGEPPGDPSTTSSTVPTTAGPGGDRRVAVAEDTREFAMIGVTLPEPPAEPVLVRTAPAGGPWTAWQALVFEDDTPRPPAGGGPAPREREEGAPGAHSEPVWVAAATRYELSLTARALPAAQVHLVHETTRDVAVAETAPAGADPARPPVSPRSAWGARAPRTAPTTAPSLQLAVVHHSAGVNGYTAAEVPALLRSIQAYHMDANGWNDIAYNFAVDGFGRVWEGRAGGAERAVVGAHAQGFNTGSTGVVVLGNFEPTAPSSAAVGAVGTLLAWKFGVHRVDPRTAVSYRTSTGSPKYPAGSTVRTNRIIGHRDVGSTACPGRNLYARLATIRDRAAAGYPAYVAPGIPLAGDFVGDGATDLYLRQPGLLDDRLYAGGPRGFSIVRDFGTTGSGAFSPFVGDFDGNGADDIFWYAWGTGGEYLWRSPGNGTFQSTRAPAASSGFVPVAGDLDGDGDDDIFWYSPNTGRDFIWFATGGGAFRSVVANPADGGYAPLAGDFDGDGDADILWSTFNANRDFLWTNRGDGTFTATVAPAVDRWSVALAGDFDGDRDDDVVWYAPGSAADHLWLSDRGRFSSRALSAGGAYRPAAGDFDGEGVADVLWYASPGPDWAWWHTTVPLGRSARLGGDLP